MTPDNASAIPARRSTSDYASKQWGGLVKDYYGERARLVQRLALGAAGQGAAGVDAAALDRLLAAHAFNWTTSQAPYPTAPVGDAAAVSRALLAKYAAEPPRPLCAERGELGGGAQLPVFVRVLGRTHATRACWARPSARKRESLLPS